jgi:hypothetical protein
MALHDCSDAGAITLNTYITNAEQILSIYGSTYQSWALKKQWEKSKRKPIH